MLVSRQGHENNALFSRIRIGEQLTKGCER